MKTYSDITGDGGSKILEQVIARQKAITKRLSSIKHLLLIGSGKGGVGKSTVTIQLAMSLIGKGYKVSLVDADFNGPCIAHLAGISGVSPIPGSNGMIPPRTKDGLSVFSYGGVLGSREALEFDNVATGDSYVWRATKEFATFSDILASAHWGEQDFLLVDLPPGPERTFAFVEFFGPRAKVVVVSHPTAISHGVVKRSVSALCGLPNDILGYVENMSGYLCKGCNKLQPLFDENVGDKLDIALLGEVPFDPELSALCDNGITLEKFINLRSSFYINNIADNIVRELENEISMRAV
jgi:ATP-binding protein involved in chromosome partitioning